MISAIVLTHNNQETLAATLTSLMFADERIVIDDASTDDTQTIAQTHGATVYTHALDGDFACQRNFGLEKATQPWVLFVDSDEIVPHPLQREILENISQAGEQGQGICGYVLKREDIFLGKTLHHGETACVRLVRLARKDAGIWTRPIHEVWDIPGPKKTLMTPLVHMAHTSLGAFITDINSYTTLNAAYLYRHGVKSSLWTIIMFPFVKFLQNYFWRRGFLDGTAGFVMAMMMSMHSFLTRAKLYMLWTKDNVITHSVCDSQSV